ncbi:CHAT domain-containing protein [Trichothermofontia sichuanensis B231]|uniref:CHAT domain-containing protein n=1 Tax=Trichothermofontia sichuanensis TaxID=3045816 RepID=UPI002248257D|nr:CHAT domain-containing protein [Trichothermofontia sichuanensis]UZQ56270.1 CHAT domain-containing protein [Trichothermofontia sichuanensis B231]
MRFNGKRSHLRFLFLVVLVTLLCIAAAAVAQPPPSPQAPSAFAVATTADRVENLRQQAAQLTAQGHEQLNNGQPEAALQTWGQALKLYQDLQYADGIAGSQINRSLAWLALGHDRQACTTSLTAIQLTRISELCHLRDLQNYLPDAEKYHLTQQFEQLTPTPIMALGLRVASESLRKLGEIEVAKQLLSKSLDIASTLQLAPEIARDYLSLSNLKVLFYRSTQEIADRRDNKLERDRRRVIDTAKQVLDHYHRAITVVNRYPEEPHISNLLRINQLSFLIEYEQWLNANQNYLQSDTEKQQIIDVKNSKQSTIASLLDTSDLFSGLSAIDGFYARLKFAQGLMQSQDLGQNFTEIAFQLTTEALTLAKQLDNPRLQAIALTELGNLHQEMGHLWQAKTYTEQGLLLAQRLNADEITFREQHQLGKIYQRLGDIKAAIAAYQAAIVDLESVRKEVLYNSSDLLFSFRNKIEPIYRELIALYLEQAPQPTPETLREIIKVNKNFQQVELENFLKCGLYSSEMKVVLEEAAAKQADTIIYLISLKAADKVLIIVNRPHQTLQSYMGTWHELRTPFNVMQTILGSSHWRAETLAGNHRLTATAKSLYQKILQPIRPYLPTSGNLLFVVDSDLQGIPFALLQDEHDRYLIEDYTIAYIPGSYIRPLKALDLKRSQALISGAAAGEAFRVDGLEPLNFVQPEIKAIQPLLKPSSIALLDQDFTVSELQYRLYTDPIAILHLATHGQFSSDPNETKIWAYDQPLTLPDLDRLLREKTQKHSVDLELLVLSACETAKDDRRGGLGLAGVAIRAGARSTVGSLWQVNDESTALLMQQFYRSLRQGESRAESLCHAQLTLLHHPDPQYHHPYHWAAFILVGSWT